MLAPAKQNAKGLVAPATDSTGSQTPPSNQNQTSSMSPREKKAAEKAARRKAASERKKIVRAKSDKAVMRMLEYSGTDDLSALYPSANGLERYFILHVGPTNSGKTYTALQALKAAETGTFLAPLRLLAMEVQEELDAEPSITCSLLTGEEQDIKENATHISSTVEMVNLRKHFDVAVIDEVQMITDPQRGGAWTEAITSLQADEIHLCFAPEALNLIESIVGSLGCEYEVEEHTRNCPLLVEPEPFSYPDSVRAGDALIAFSRREVLSTADSLRALGKRVSVVYGALPYEARKEEVRKFADGETDVVVATDAIGMGLNLPVERVVFLKTRKFDGVSVRSLKQCEVKQIAGRAGRLGKYDMGYVNTRYDKGMIKSMVEEESAQCKSKAVLSFPRSFLEVDLPVSKVMTLWSNGDKGGVSPYARADMSEPAALALNLEGMKGVRGGEFTKEEIFYLSTIPFDSKKDAVFLAWINLAKSVHNPPSCARYILEQINSIVEAVESEYMWLELAEHSFKVLDMFVGFTRVFLSDQEDEIIPIIQVAKKRVAVKIIAIMAGKASSFGF